MENKAKFTEEKVMNQVVLLKNGSIAKIVGGNQSFGFLLEWENGNQSFGTYLENIIEVFDTFEEAKKYPAGFGYGETTFFGGDAMFKDCATIKTEYNYNDFNKYNKMTGTNNICIGANAGIDLTDESYQLRLIVDGKEIKETMTEREYYLVSNTLLASNQIRNLTKNFSD